VPARVSPSEAIRAQIDELFADPERELGAVLEDVARLSVRLVFQAALEAESPISWAASATPAATALASGPAMAMATSRSKPPPVQSS
jgi:hypothetical protein